MPEFHSSPPRTTFTISIWLTPVQSYLSTAETMKALNTLKGRMHKSRKPSCAQPTLTNAAPNRAWSYRPSQLSPYPNSRTRASPTSLVPPRSGTCTTRWGMRSRGPVGVIWSRISQLTNSTKKIAPAASNPVPWSLSPANSASFLSITWSHSPLRPWSGRLRRIIRTSMNTSNWISRHRTLLQDSV